MAPNNNTILLLLLAIIAIYCYRQSSEKFEPAPPCPFRPTYDSPDSTPGPDLKAIADAALLATPPMPSPLPELYSQASFFGWK